jgi:ADP-ribose pyrophosphatase
MSARARILRSKSIYNGKIFQLRLEPVVEPGGIRAVREVVYHGGSVVVLPELDDGQILLVRQYRFPARQSLWELVAGGMEPGETPKEAARRELQEETGYRARTLEFLMVFYPSPGILTEQMYLIRAQGLSRGENYPEADERIAVGRFTRRELRRLVRQGKIRDGKTLVGLLWLLGGWRRLNRRRTRLAKPVRILS